MKFYWGISFVKFVSTHKQLRVNVKNEYIDEFSIPYYFVPYGHNYYTDIQ